MGTQQEQGGHSGEAWRQALDEAIDAVAQEISTRDLGGYVVQCEGCEASTRVWFPVKDDVRVLLTQAWNRRASARLTGEPPRFTVEDIARAIPRLESMAQAVGLDLFDCETIPNMLRDYQRLAARAGETGETR